MNLALIITDLDNKIVYTNGQTEEITGYSEEELFDKYREQLKVKKIMPAAFAELQGDFLYMLTTPSREEMEQMIEDFGKKA